MCHHFSSQFTIQVRDCNKIEEDFCQMNLSELLDLLCAFTTLKNLKYTVTECMLDQFYDTVLRKGLTEEGYENNGFICQ